VSSDNFSNSLETRDEDRDSMFLMAELAIDGGRPAQRVKVRNLSPSGMMCESDVRPRRGDRVAVDLRNVGAVAGTVVWVRGSKFGIAFEEEIDPKMARTQVAGGPKEAPVYARAAVDAPRHDGWNGKLRRI
jgi:hypothetical protein